MAREPSTIRLAHLSAPRSLSDPNVVHRVFACVGAKPGARRAVEDRAPCGSGDGETHGRALARALVDLARKVRR
jgi:hypothetical protein